MRALTVRQPWAHLIITGKQPYENRSWKTIYRGPVLVHSALTISDHAMYVCQEIVGHDIDRAMLRTGSLIGVALLTGIITPSMNQPRSIFFTGPFGWILDRPREFKTPIEAIGKQGLWIPPTDIIERIERENPWLKMYRQQTA
jgi:hypothetical protein